VLRPCGAGDGIKMAMAIGAGTVDMASVQVHPTGLVHEKEPDAKVKFLAAEALRGVGGILVDANGERFCDELGRRDYVSGRGGGCPRHSLRRTAPAHTRRNLLPGLANRSLCGAI